MSANLPTRPSAPSNFLSGVLGGLVVLVVGAVLIATGVIDTGSTTTKREVVRETAPARAASHGGADQRTVSDIYKQEGQGVVFIQARGTSSGSPFGLPQEGDIATGSGFVVGKDGTIVTNAHVVEGSQDISVRFEEQGDFVDAKVVGRDPSTDVAVLKVDPGKAKLQPVPLGDSSKVEVGQPVIAIGNPFGFTRTVTTGIVSALQRQIQAPNGFSISNVIQTDASINPGNSGGPLLDADGKVIGITSQIATGGTSGSVGIGFAIPINTVKSELPRLKKNGKVERAYLGVEMASVTAQVARDLNLPVKRGALVTTAVRGGPAAAAGIHGGRTPTGQGIVAGGDLIVKVDGKAVRTPDDVAGAIADDKPGDTVEIQYYRGKRKRTVKVKLGKRPSALQDTQSPQGGGGGLFP